MTTTSSKATVVSLDAYRRRRMRAAPPRRSVAQFYPRVTIDDPVQITLFNGMVVRLRLGDISLDGIRLRTDKVIADVLRPESDVVDIELAPKTLIALDLPLPGGELRVLVRCRLARFEKVDEDAYTFTLHFITFEGAGKSILKHYLNLCRLPSVLPARRRVQILPLESGKAQ